MLAKRALRVEESKRRKGGGARDRDAMLWAVQDECDDRKNGVSSGRAIRSCQERETNSSHACEVLRTGAR